MKKKLPQPKSNIDHANPNLTSSYGTNETNKANQSPDSSGNNQVTKVFENSNLINNQGNQSVDSNQKKGVVPFPNLNLEKIKKLAKAQSEIKRENNFFEISSGKISEKKGENIYDEIPNRVSNDPSIKNSESKVSQVIPSGYEVNDVSQSDKEKGKYQNMENFPKGDISKKEKGKSSINSNISENLNEHQPTDNSSGHVNKDSTKTKLLYSDEDTKMPDGKKQEIIPPQSPGIKGNNININNQIQPSQNYPSGGVLSAKSKYEVNPKYIKSNSQKEKTENNEVLINNNANNAFPQSNKEINPNLEATKNHSAEQYRSIPDTLILAQAKDKVTKKEQMSTKRIENNLGILEDSKTGSTSLSNEKIPNPFPTSNSPSKNREEQPNMQEKELKSPQSIPNPQINVFSQNATDSSLGNRQLKYEVVLEGVLPREKFPIFDQFPSNKKEIDELRNPSNVSQSKTQKKEEKKKTQTKKINYQQFGNDPNV